MSRKEQISMSILGAVKLSFGGTMREDILFRTVSMEMQFLQANPSEIKQAIRDLEMGGKLKSDRDDYGVVRFILTDAGKADCILRDI